MSHYTQKAKELKAQFGDNAKYVVLEIIEEWKGLTSGRASHPNFVHVKINRIDYWRAVKTELEKPQ